MANLKKIVSMLVSETKVMLFTIEGEVLDMKVDGPHDTAKLSAEIGPKLNGTNAVDVDLDEYLTIKQALESINSPEGYENEGIVVVQIIDGKEVQGIFYPQKVQVAVKLDGEDVVVPDIEKLEKHMNRASKENSPAVRNFLRRLAPVIKNRLHSAEDLMSFIERSELPLTNDGKIIGYKRVNKRRDGVYVDCHSGSVEQSVGSRVWMEVDLVDPSRSNSCSVGLHVANLGYLRSFGGSHTLIVLVDPADFIAVPHGETNKCRVASYDIIGVMNSASQDIVNSGIHVEGDMTLKNLIRAAVEGKSVKPFEKVQVGNRKTLGRVRLDVNQTEETGFEKSETESSGESLNTDQSPEARSKDVMSSAKAVVGATKNKWDAAEDSVLLVFEDLFAGEKSKSQIAADHNTSTRTIGRWSEKYDYEGWAAAKAATPEEETKETGLTDEASFNMDSLEGSLKEQARELFSRGFLNLLKQFKTSKKKSWYALGFNDAEIVKITRA